MITDDHSLNSLQKNSCIHRTNTFKAELIQLYDWPKQDGGWATTTTTK